MAALKAILERRQHLVALRSEQRAPRQRQEKLELKLLAGPTDTWAKAAAKAEFLILLFAATPEAQDPRRQRLVASVLDDFSRLGEIQKEPE